MIKILLTAVLAFAFLPAAHADEYSDRAKLAQQRQNQEYQTRYWNNVYSGNVRDFRALAGFIARNGGLVEDGSVQMMTASCDTASYSNQSYCHGTDYVTVPYSQLDPNAAYYFISARFNLRNGLACSVWEDILDGGYKASCFDANGIERKVNFGAGAAGPARGKVLRKRKK